MSIFNAITKNMCFLLTSNKMVILWILILPFSLMVGAKKCIPNKIELWSTVKCEAGRRFFARLSNPNIVQPYLYPWLAEIKISSKTKIKKLCTGCLINDRYILTVQHCLIKDIEPGDIEINLGSSSGYKQDISEIFQPRTLNRTVVKILRHPRYNLVLLLIQPVQYSKTIFPIKLPSFNDNFNNINTETVVWNFQDTHKKSLKTEMVTVRECSNFGKNYVYNELQNFWCSSSSINIKTGICGDAIGGLLTIQKPTKIYEATILIGIVVSQYVNCKNPTAPIVYLKINKHMEWIKDNTKGAQYCRF